MNKLNQKIYNKYNTIKKKQLKRAVYFTDKKKEIVDEITNANNKLDFLDNFINENDLGKHMFPIRRKSLQHKVNTADAKITQYTNYVNSIELILSYIAETDNINNLNILNIICNENIVLNKGDGNPYSYNFNLINLNALDYTLKFIENKKQYYNSTYILVDTVLAIDSINIVLQSTPCDGIYSLYQFFHSGTINGNDSYKFFLSMKDDDQANFILKFLELQPNLTKLDFILNLLKPNTKAHDIVAKYTIFK